VNRRTTLNTEEALLRRLKLAAARSDQTISEIAERALRFYLDSRQEPREGRIKLPTSKRDMRLWPGINLNSSASVAEIVDEEYFEEMLRIPPR